MHGILSGVQHVDLALGIWTKASRPSGFASDLGTKGRGGNKEAENECFRRAGERGMVEARHSPRPWCEQLMRDEVCS